MKNFARTLGLLLCFGLILSACGKTQPQGESGSALPCPAFPLDEAAVRDALERSGLEGEISASETDSYGEGHAIYVIRSRTVTGSGEPFTADTPPEDGLLIAASSSALRDGARVYQAWFNQRDVSETFRWEDWKPWLVFAALQYGGMTDEEEIFRACRTLELPEKRDAMVWEVPLSGGYCVISYAMRDYDQPRDDVPAIKAHSATMCLYLYPSRELFEAVHPSSSGESTADEP